MDKEQLAELYLQKRDTLEPDERRMIVGLLGFAAATMQAPPAIALPTPTPIGMQPVVLVAPTTPVQRSREGYKFSDETRRRARPRRPAGLVVTVARSVMKPATR